MKRFEFITKYFTLFSLGFFGLLAQALIFRTFLIAFDGNELSMGLFFFSWLIWVCIGAWVARRQLIAKFANYFYIVILLYLPAYLIQQYLFIHARSIIGGHTFELVSLNQLIPFVLLFNAPISFMTGLLFVFGADWIKKSSVPVIKIYVCESFGSFIGALLVTILLYMGYLEETIFLVAAIIVLLSTVPQLFYSRSIINWTFRIITPTLVIGVLFLLYSNFAQKWDTYNNRAEWHSFLRNGQYQGTFYTPQAKYLYGEYRGEFIVTAWNSTYEALPNLENSSITVGTYLAENPDAKNILVVGPGSYSICRTFCKLPQVKKVVWLDTDPDYPEHLLKIIPDEYKKAITKIDIPRNDPRKYIKNSNSKFDLVILNIPNPSTLLLNKYFTFDIFKQLKKIITPKGVIGINFPAGANYMGTELTFMGSSLLYTLRQVFHQNIVIKPGDVSCFFTAKQNGIVSDSGPILLKRLNTIVGIKGIFNPENILSFFEKSRITFQMKKYEDTIKKYPHKLFFNTDDNPKTFLYTLLFTIKKLGNAGFTISGLNTLLRTVFPYAVLLILIYFFLRPFYYYCYGTKIPKEKRIPKHINLDLHKTELYLSIFAAAISGLGINLILIFLFQIYFGSIFLYFGLITALFMLGLFISGLLMESLLKAINTRSALIISTLLYLLYIALLYYCPPEFSKAYFAILFLSAGLFSGPFFALTAFYLKGEGISEVQSGSRLEIIDNFGGAIGSIICSIIFIPILGISLTLCIISSFWGVILLHAILLRGKIPSKAPWLTQYIRVIGFTMFATIVVLLYSSNFYFPQKRTEKAGWKLTKQEIFELDLDKYQLAKETQKKAGTPYTYYVVKDKNQTVGYILRTKDFSKEIIGYAGPIHMLSFVAPNGKIQNFTILESNETPIYLKEILKSRQVFLGQNVLSQQYQINAITGATLTSTAISRILFHAANNFLAQILGKKQQQTQAKVLQESYSLLPLILLILFTITAIILRRSNSRIMRYFFLSAVLIILGFIFNLQYSADQIFSLVSFKFYFSQFNPFLFLCLLIPIVTMIFGNIYCGYICPFGALQELIHSAINPILKKLGIIKNPKLNKAVWKLGRTIKYIILFILLIFYISWQNKRIAENTDVLQSAFSLFFSSNLTLYFILFLILISLFYKRFWCRVLCPSGAFLSLFNAVRVIRGKTKIQIAKCDLGIFENKAFDCICCDNCRKTQPSPKKTTRVINKYKLYNYIFIFLAVVCLYFMLISIHKNYEAIKSIKTEADTTQKQTLPPPKKTVKFSATSSLLKSIGIPRNIDIQKYKSYINKKFLSNKPAMYYRKIGK